MLDELTHRGHPVNPATIDWLELGAAIVSLAERSATVHLQEMAGVRAESAAAPSRPARDLMEARRGGS